MGWAIRCIFFAFRSTRKTISKNRSLEVARKRYYKNIRSRLPVKNVIVKGIVKDKKWLTTWWSFLKGTTVGTETDFDGKFKFPTPLKKGDILIFSYLDIPPKN